MSRPQTRARRRRVAIALLALGGCGEVATPQPLVVAPPSPVPSVRAPDDRLVAARASSGTPAGFVLDGDLGEWSILVDPPRTRVDAGERRSEPDTPTPVRNAASHVAVALTPTGALLAGELRGAASGGVWITLGFSGLALPILGRWTHGGWTAEADCQAPGETMHGTEHVLTEADVYACEAALVEGEAFAARWDARFRHRYLVDATGVRRITAAGPEIVREARVAWRASPGGATFEATLPALALPLCGEAPVTTIALSAAPASREDTAPATGAALLPEPVAEWHDVDPPIGFEPNADHRAILFEGWARLAGLNGPLAYQPGEPSAMWWAGYASQEEWPYSDRMQLEVSPRELITRDRAFGDLAIGSIDGQGIAVWRGDVLLGTGGSGVRAWVERDGELFGVSWSKWLSDETWTESASFEAFSIRPDGTFREGLIHPVEPFFHWVAVDAVTASEDLRTLVIRGTSRNDPHPARRTTIVTWRYESRTRDWRPRVTHEPRPVEPE